MQSRLLKAIKSRQGRNLILGVVLFLTAWLLATALCYVLVKCDAGYWIELFNGATWPVQFAEAGASGRATSGRAWLFYGIVGLRTVINLGIVLSAVSFLYLLSTGQVKEWIMSKLESVLSTRDTALTTHLIKKMEGVENIELTPQFLDMLYAAADEFRYTEAGRRFSKSAASAVQAAAQNSDHI